jgi:hypothetical protein
VTWRQVRPIRHARTAASQSIPAFLVESDLLCKCPVAGDMHRRLRHAARHFKPAWRRSFELVRPTHTRRPGCRGVQPSFVFPNDHAFPTLHARDIEGHPPAAGDRAGKKDDHVNHHRICRDSSRDRFPAPAASAGFYPDFQVDAVAPGHGWNIPGAGQAVAAGYRLAGRGRSRLDRGPREPILKESSATRLRATAEQIWV